MPGATSTSFSRRQSAAVQSIQRWDSTRQPNEAEQRRRTVNYTPESNAWERPDWPLSAPSAANEEALLPAAPATKGRGRAKMREEQVAEGAAMRKPEDFGVQVASEYGYTFEDHDVSDIEEEQEDKDDEETTPSHSSTPSLGRPHDSPLFHLHLSPNPGSAQSHRATLEALESPQRATRLPDVSPVREQLQEENGPRSIGRNRDYHTHPHQPDLQHHGQHQQQEYNHQQYSTRRQSGVQLQLNGQETFEEDDDADADELRDSVLAAGPIANIIPRPSNISPSSRSPILHQSSSSPLLQQGSRVNSPVLQQGSRLSFHALPNSSSAPRSSVAKAPMHSPPHRRTSTRSSYNTTQIPYNKERVRYSWQSLQDDEPNRPRIHIIKLVSNTATASAGFPTGEAFGFSMSPGGRRIAVYNSARLYVLQTAALPVGISQDYALKRRPLAVELTDDGSTMAILADPHVVNIYDVGHQLRRTHTIKLDFPATCIALAPTGGLLAAAYTGGLEIFSLDPSALPTDRRAVRTFQMDRMAFSEDGSTLLGTTTRVNVSSTVVVSVPVFPSAPSGVPTHAELKEAWCSELLHPENIRNSSHASFMRESRTTCNERVFAWNGSEDTFGVLSVADMHYENVDFPVVISPPLSTCGGLGAAIHSCPAIDEHGDTVAMIVNDRTIRLYIVPEKSEATGVVEAHSIDHELDEGYGCPFSEVRWVHSSASLPAPAEGGVKGRLIVTSPGGVMDLGISSEESVEDIEGGRIILFDFDPQFAGQPGQTFCLNLGGRPAVLLEEEAVDVAEQVALVRRRTVNQRERGGLSQRPGMLGRAATTYGKDRRAPGRNNRNSLLSIGTLQSESSSRSLPDLLESGEQADFYEEPYVQGQPRSGVSLQRAASNAQRHRYQALEERNRESISVDQSSGNFLALPEYSEEPNAPLPQRFRALAGLDGPSTFNPVKAAGDPTVNGHGNAYGVPMSAPPDIGERFSADAAFRDANANVYRPESSNNFYPTLRGGEPYRPVSPATSTRTLDSMQSMARSAFLPRGLQRAYSNAVSPLASTNTLDWRNMSPQQQGVSPLVPPQTSRSNVSAMGEDEPWDTISPVGTGPVAPFGQRMSLIQNANRFSTTSKGVESVRNASVVSGSTSSQTHSGYSRPSDGQHLPPHMLAFRQAAAAQSAATASLFPPPADGGGWAADQIPLRHGNVNVGQQPHPITGWHPPAPGSGHSRKSSVSAAGSRAFASTGKAKKLGFFKKRGKGREGSIATGREGSIVTGNGSENWIGKEKEKEKGCVIM